jgi:fatty-acyl-CoA synthase
MPGLEVRIGAESGAPGALDERAVGEIQVRGPSVTPGYIRDAQATADAMTEDGWLRTGDLGYLAGDHLFPCGRTKDVIILRGRNLHAHDVEAIVGALPQVRTGNVVAFGCANGDGEERLIVVAETREPEQAPTIVREIRGRLGEALGVVPDEVAVVAPGTLPKTSSGKLKRAETRSRYEAGTLEERSSSFETVGVALRSGWQHVMNRVRAG